MADTEQILRVGIIGHGYTFPRWQAGSLAHVRTVPGVRIAALLVVPTKAVGSTSWNTTLYRRYFQGSFKPKALDPLDLGADLAGIPVITIPDVGDGPFPPQILSDIAAQRCDILLDFGTNPVKGEILALPPHGVWRFLPGIPGQYHSGPAGFREILDHTSLTRFALQRLTTQRNTVTVLRQGWFRTLEHSLEATVDSVLLPSACWPAQVLRELRSRSSEVAVGTDVQVPEIHPREPGNLEFLKFLWEQHESRLKWKRQRTDQQAEWNVGILHQPIATLLDEDASLNVRWLPAPAFNNIRETPFGYMTTDGVNMLYGKFDHARGKSEISRLRPKNDNVLKRSRTMLRNEGHLTYPYVLKHQGVVYVVPESIDDACVDLYRVGSDNDSLEPVCTLLNEPLHSPTLFQHEGLWWLFGTSPSLPDAALNSYWSEQLEGPYHPHEQNPVKLDVRSARPAGTPFVHQGMLWRPAQDRSHVPGDRIAMNRVLDLTPARFREETMHHVGPIGNTLWCEGMRTVAAMGDITFIDGKRTVDVRERRKEIHQRARAKQKHRARP